MYNNILKAKILELINSELRAANIRMESELNTIPLHDKLNPKQNRKLADKIGKVTIYLSFEKFVEVKVNLQNQTSTIRLLDKGVSAVTSDYFREENTKQVLLFVRDLLLVISSIILTIATAIALTKKDNVNVKIALPQQQVEIDSLKAQMKQLQLKLDTPNNPKNHSKDSE